MINRRTFLKGSAAAIGAAMVGGVPVFAKPAMAHRLTVVHTNDVHSWLDPMDTGDYKGLGGAEARAAAIARIRAENANVLVLDAGDMFQGTPYFNLWKGEPEVKMMNAMGFDASTIGNHEFDAGIERLAELARDHMKYPLLNCNYDFRNTPMAGLTKEYLVLERGGMRIGLLGLGIRLDNLVMPSLMGETRYNDPIANARRVARILKHDEQCDFVVCLSHINLYAVEEGRRPEKDPGDRNLVVDVPEIDLILGGHNHVRLDELESHPRAGAPAGWVAQTGWAGTHLGVYQFDVYAKAKRELALGRVQRVEAFG